MCSGSGSEDWSRFQCDHTLVGGSSAGGMASVLRSWSRTPQPLRRSSLTRLRSQHLRCGHRRAACLRARRLLPRRLAGRPCVPFWPLRQCNRPLFSRAVPAVPSWRLMRRGGHRAGPLYAWDLCRRRLQCDVLTVRRGLLPVAPGCHRLLAVRDGIHVPRGQLYAHSSLLLSRHVP